MNRQSGQYLVQGDWKLANPRSGRVENRVGNGCTCATNSKFSNALASKHIGVAVGFLQENDIEFGHIGTHRNMVFRKIMIDEVPISRVKDTFFHQRGTYSPDHAAE